MCRELSRDERKGIRKLVTEMCANYDRDYGCLPLDCECYMSQPSRRAECEKINRTGSSKLSRRSLSRIIRS